MTEDTKKNEEVLGEGDLSTLVRTKDGGIEIVSKTGPSFCSPEATRKFALQRLVIDLLQMREEPLPMIAAIPLDEDKNLWEWHCNLMGPPGSSYEDICFHFIFKIPENYPASPPKVRLQSYIEHPNVFRKYEKCDKRWKFDGFWICLDLLEGEWIPDDHKKQKKNDVGYGWTPAYSIQTILVQLQAFLFDLCDTTWWASNASKWGYTSTVINARQGARHFNCKGCKHKGTKPYPEPEAWKNRLKYMIPHREFRDIYKTKNELWNFIETIDSMVNRNMWPSVLPLEPGNFFSHTLVPWYDTAYISILEQKRELGCKKMKPNLAKVIRGLIKRTVAFLNSKPAPLPSKALYLERMYRLESALDIAVNSTFSSKFKNRNRGYWQWFNKDMVTLSKEAYEKAKKIKRFKK